jgi:hypothetical protein
LTRCRRYRTRLLKVNDTNTKPFESGLDYVDQELGPNGKNVITSAEFFTSGKLKDRPIILAGWVRYHTMNSADINTGYLIQNETGAPGYAIEFAVINQDQDWFDYIMYRNPNTNDRESTRKGK